MCSWNQTYRRRESHFSIPWSVFSSDTYVQCPHRQLFHLPGQKRETTGESETIGRNRGVVSFSNVKMKHIEDIGDIRHSSSIKG